MCSLHLVHNRLVFFFLCLIYGVLQVLTNHRLVGRDDDNVHGIDVAELFFLCLGSTRHTCLLRILVEEVLECYGSQGAGLPAHIYVLLSLDCLMKSVGITAAGHNTACEFIYNQDLVILYNIILIPEHQVIGAQSQDNVMLDLQVLRICQVFNMEVLLHFLDTLFCQVYYLILFIHNEIACLLNLLAHDGVDLGEFLGYGTSLQLAGQYIAHLIQLGGLAALSGNDKRRPGLVNQHGVNLIDDTVIQVAQHQLLLINGHVIAQVIESQLIICHVSNVAGICLLTLFTCHVVQYNAHGHAQESVHLTHPLGVTLCQIVIDRYDLDALSLQCIQVCGTGGYQSLTFTSTHLGNTALMQYDTADQLYREMLHIQSSSCRLTDSGKRLRQNVIQRCALCKPFSKDSGLVTQFLIRHGHHLGTQRFNLCHDWPYHLQFSFTVSPEHLFNQVHGILS